MSRVVKSIEVYRDPCQRCVSFTVTKMYGNTEPQQVTIACSEFKLGASVSGFPGGRRDADLCRSRRTSWGCHFVDPPRSVLGLETRPFSAMRLGEKIGQGRAMWKASSIHVLFCLIVYGIVQTPKQVFTLQAISYIYMFLALCF